MPVISEEKAAMSKAPLIRVDGKIYRLTPRQELFCRKYVETSNATKSYEETYGNDKKYSDLFAYRIMSRPHIQIRIQQLMQACGFNDLSVANEHRKIIMNGKNKDKLKAIDMYYKIRDVYAPQKKEVTVTRITEERKKELDNLIDIL